VKTSLAAAGHESRAPGQRRPLRQVARGGSAAAVRRTAVESH